MSEKLTAEEYLEGQYGTTDITGYVKLTTVIAARHYGDLRAKEAVEKFARELIKRSGAFKISDNDVIQLAKQHGVEL